jgi:quercetin dioxygenase-like cupin family protein
MNNREVTKAIDAGYFPLSANVPLDKPFVDDRGIIQNLLLTPINSVAIITSKAGSIRSNHYHKTDWHYLYVISGSLKYYERDVDGPSQEPIVVKAGQMIFTPPMAIHKTEFLEDTVMMSFAKNIRDHEHHEQDLVREEY